jgi:hypothetical protein
MLDKLSPLSAAEYAAHKTPKDLPANLAANGASGALQHCIQQ